MKKIFLNTIFIFVVSVSLFAQANSCNELFISEYLEGYGNNRALELYNPTNATIDLSNYSIGRFSNGSTEFTSVKIPNGHSIAPYGTFVIVVDKRDSLGEGLETPIWNGYQLWDVCLDELTMEPIIDNNGDTVYCVQYDEMGAPLYGTEYHDFLDLEGKADVFLTPVYNDNSAIYWNGNDAVALIEGTTVNPDGSNIIDVVGVIGEDPESTIGEPAWVDENGFWLTRDRTLVRKPEVTGGTGPVVGVLQDTFAYDQWISLPKNTFTELGMHESVCQTSSTKDINIVDFTLYPNPVSGDVLQITAEEEIKGFVIRDAYGKTIIQSGDVRYGNSHRMHISGLMNGIYYVAIDFGDKGTTVRKLIRLKG